MPGAWARTRALHAPRGRARRARRGETSRREKAGGSRAFRRVSGGPARRHGAGPWRRCASRRSARRKELRVPTAIFQRRPTVGFDLQVSTWESAARLAPEEARSSSDIPRAFRRSRRCSATRRPSSAAPTSSPGPARGRSREAAVERPAPESLAFPWIRRTLSHVLLARRHGVLHYLGHITRCETAFGRSPP